MSARGAWPNSASLVVGQIRHQNRVFWRTPIAAFFTLALPTMFLLLFVAIFGNDELDTPLGRLTTAQFYAPGLAAFAAASATYTNLGINLSIRRDEGILKRVRGTPLPAWVYMAGAVGSAVWIALIGVVVMMGIGVVLFGVELQADKLAAAVVTFVVGVASLAALGLALAAVAPSGTAAPAIANATILPLAFVSNVFVPLEDPPRWLDLLGDIFPLKPFVESFQLAFDPSSPAPGFRWAQLGVLVAWAIAGAVVAIRFFRWEPRPGATGRRSRRSRTPEPTA